MDDTQFNRLTQHLACEASRRRLLGGIVGAAATGVTSVTVLAAKGKGKGKGQGYGGGRGAGPK